ncbi:unnamed protein product [Protopolystoma xenopodis]|uniref:Pyruvate kinase C-terminal domain-containing protein n=1 Tax=Protopolystoma xenopodis TaxID=117903 RepID=A0A3S5AXG4_9PLAT|nr:unnamed protein product [Protopolystoma xenopodis]
MDARLNAALQIARSRGFVKEGDQIVIVTGWASGHSSTNTVRVHQVPKAETKLQVVCSSSCLTSR